MSALARRGAHQVRITGFLAIATGAWVLACWALERPDLAGLVPGMPPVLPGAAFWMILTGAALPLAGKTPAQERVTAALALVGLGIGLAHLVLDFMPWAAELPLTNGVTGLSMALLSLGLLLRDRSWRRDLDPMGMLAVAAMVVPYYALMGYSLQLTALYRPVRGHEQALPTAIVLILVAVGLLVSRPERAWIAQWNSDSLSGTLVRRQIPVALIAPVVLGVLALAGEGARLYSRELTIGFFLILSGLVGIAHIVMTARSLNDLETARAAAIRDLRGSESMFRGLMEGASDAILVLDELGRITFKNRQSASLFGYESGELIGMPIERLVPERFRSSHGSRIASYMRSPERRTLENVPELHALRQDGSEFPAEISLSPVETVEGSFVMVLIRDLTDRRQASEAMALARALERADALKDEFLNIVSHELRTPISVLSGTISLLEYEMDGPLSAPQRRDVARMRESTDHLLLLVNDLLDMSMIHAGKLTILPRPMHVGDLIEGAVEIVQPLARERGIAILTDLAPDLPVLNADGQRIRQVIINLITNALKYSPTGSTVGIRVVLGDSGLRCEITDQGPGIAAEDHGRIFEKFTRIHADAAVDGAGLGLYICQALVAAHDGDIGVVSDGNAGSTFWFTLPHTR